MVEASSGFDAMRLLPRGPYDLIITDINMADINGLELIRFIRSSAHHRTTPLLIISTLRAEHDVERGLALGRQRLPGQAVHARAARAICARLLAARRPAPEPTGRGRRRHGRRRRSRRWRRDKARDEFFSEAQELVDGLGRDLLQLDEGLEEGRSTPSSSTTSSAACTRSRGCPGSSARRAWRGCRTSSRTLLDDLRLGRIELTTAVLDLLFQAVSLYTRILAAEKGEAPEPVAEVDELLVALGDLSRAGRGRRPATSPSTISIPACSGC